jgi:hypothetical protein
MTEDAAQLLGVDTGDQVVDRLILVADGGDAEPAPRAPVDDLPALCVSKEVASDRPQPGPGRAAFFDSHALPALEGAGERLLGDVERQLAVTARCRERGDQPRDVPVVERDDRLGIVPQAA